MEVPDSSCLVGLMGPGEIHDSSSGLRLRVAGGLVTYASPATSQAKAFSAQIPAGIVAPPATAIAAPIATTYVPSGCLTPNTHTKPFATTAYAAPASAAAVCAQPLPVAPAPVTTAYTVPAPAAT
eukprot:449147-Amphidinium_carterae.2